MRKLRARCDSLEQSVTAFRGGEELRCSVCPGEGLQYGSASPPLIAVKIEKEKPRFLGKSCGLLARKLSVSFFVDVLLRAGMARWMTAALFGPVGSSANKLIMLPGEMQKAVCQEHSAV